MYNENKEITEDNKILILKAIEQMYEIAKMLNED